MRRDDEATLNDVVQQLAINNRLLAAQIKASGTLNQHQLIDLLSSTGASSRVIADVLDISPDAVRMVLARERKKAANEDVEHS